ncbi:MULTISPECIES: barstar family protein [Pantoea]|uniref:Barnase inhibitor n=1 Tax=Pantoea vagans TaxID=470934 RepID=A0AAN1TWB3_9GAMM|nr:MULTISPECIES: barstar family protein [Pantoea]AVV38289.1 barnase inhibitor [Pantoea vagans]
MNEIILDGSEIKNEQDFHKFMSKLLDFGPYYGTNLEALRDRLSNDVERPVTIIWINSEQSKQYLGECFHRIVQIFEKSKQQDIKFNWSERFYYILK